MNECVTIETSKVLKKQQQQQRTSKSKNARFLRSYVQTTKANTYTQNNDNKTRTEFLHTYF